MIGGVSELKGLDMVKESLHLWLHFGVGLIGGSEFSGVLCGCGCALFFVNFEARHHLVHDGVGVVESQFINCRSSLSEFKVSFAEVMFEISACLVLVFCAFPRPYVVFEDTLPVQYDKVEVYCLNLSQLCFCVYCILYQVVNGVEYDVNWLGLVVDLCLDSVSLVVESLRVDVSIVVV